MKVLLTISLLLFGSCTVANEFTVRISEESVSLILDPQVIAKNSVQFSFVHNDDESSDLISAGFFAHGSKESFDARLGGKAYYADLDNDSGYGITLGGEVFVPVNPQLKLNAGLYYGPSSLSFSDVDTFQEWFVGINYQVFDNASLGAGIGSLQLEPENGRDVDVDDGVFIEMKLSF
ncbi:MAG: YfaZ family outer membrane protein [Pseudomonadales bacterium]